MFRNRKKKSKNTICRRHCINAHHAWYTHIIWYALILRSKNIKCISEDREHGSLVIFVTLFLSSSFLLAFSFPFDTAPFGTLNLNGTDFDFSVWDFYNDLLPWWKFHVRLTWLWVLIMNMDGLTVYQTTYTYKMLVYYYLCVKYKYEHHSILDSILYSFYPHSAVEHMKKKRLIKWTQTRSAHFSYLLSTLMMQRNKKKGKKTQKRRKNIKRRHSYRAAQLFHIFAVQSMHSIGS